jgi:hypothetical protein
VSDRGFDRFIEHREPDCRARWMYSGGLGGFRHDCLVGKEVELRKDVIDTASLVH